MLANAAATQIENARLLRGGNEYEFVEPVRATDQLKVTWRIDDIYEKTTDRGALLFVISEARYLNQHGRLLAIDRETNIYQELRS